MIKLLQLPRGLAILLIFLCSIHIPSYVYSQKKQTPNKKNKQPAAVITPTQESVLPPEEVEEYKQRVKRMISFLEFALNTLGSDSTPTEDKEVITGKSYLKFFKDSKVQVEDDLDEKRTVVTYKNVPSYLQDVDYFFKNVVFDLNVDEITPYLTDKNNLYFKVSLIRFLRGVTSDGDSVRNNKQRFVEVNLDLKSKDLKIASIYSTKFNEADDLNTWWKNLPEDWRVIFKKQMGAIDSVNYGQLKRILSTDSLILTESKVTTLDPVSKLQRLKTLSISKTTLSDLSPLRNLIYLESLDISNSQVKSLEPLKYASELKELNLSNTQIGNIDAVKVFKKLEILDIHQTVINDFSPIGALTSLKNFQAYSIASMQDINFLKPLNNIEVINISATPVSNIDVIAGFENLRLLDISSTMVTQIPPMDNVKKLKEININKTSVSSLQNLKAASSLEKIYSDHSKVSKADAMQFMSEKPGALVIYESEGLTTWWSGLSADWKKVFQKYVPSGDSPTIDQLAAMARLTSVDLSGNANISSLEPIQSISAIKELKCNSTAVSSLEPLKNATGLQVIEFSNTTVSNLDPLSDLKNLKRINFDNTKVDMTALQKFKNTHPACLVIYKSGELTSWWAGVPDEWRDAFKKNIKIDSPPDNIQLHALTQLDSLIISDNGKIKNIEPLKEFQELKYLSITNTQATDLNAISGLMNLRVLNISRNPFHTLEALKTLTMLQSLDFGNTAIEEIETIKDLKTLEEIKFAGTPVDDLKYLAGLNSLRSLDCSGSKVGNLKPLDKLNMLQSLKCYNTKLSQGKVDKFKKAHPACEVLYY